MIHNNELRNYKFALIPPKRIVKVYNSVDIESAMGGVRVEDVSTVTGAHERFGLSLTKDVNTAIEWAMEASATEIVVKEDQGSMKNLILEDTDDNLENQISHNSIKLSNKIDRKKRRNN